MRSLAARFAGLKGERAKQRSCARRKETAHIAGRVARTSARHPAHVELVSASGGVGQQVDARRAAPARASAAGHRQAVEGAEHCAAGGIKRAAKTAKFPGLPYLYATFSTKRPPLGAATRRACLQLVVRTFLVPRDPVVDARARESMACRYAQQRKTFSIHRPLRGVNSNSFLFC